MQFNALRLKFEKNWKMKLYNHFGLWTAYILYNYVQLYLPQQNIWLNFHQHLFLKNSKIRIFTQFFKTQSLGRRNPHKRALEPKYVDPKHKIHDDIFPEDFRKPRERGFFR